jgi:hypothetical protein
MSEEDITPSEAFQLLGLSHDASLSEIKDAYRQLSLKQHPDVTNESSSRQVVLNKAYSIAKTQQNTKEIVAQEIAKALVSTDQKIAAANREIAIQAAIADTGVVSAGLVRKRSRRLQRIKYGVLILAASAAVFGWFGNEFVSSVFFEPESALSNALKRWAFFLGAAGGLLQFFVQYQSFLVDDLKDRLDDADYCEHMMVDFEVHRFRGNDAWFTASDVLHRDSFDDIYYGRTRLRRSMRSWIRNIPFNIFVLNDDERISLILNKAVEHELLQKKGRQRFSFSH